MTRKDLEATWAYLVSLGYSPPRKDERPFVPPAMPNADDEELGFEFFRTKVEGESLAGLTLPRTFFGRSLLERVDFHDTDLHESRLCWNDFVGCDFANADLKGADFRASNFEGCSFIGADLRGAELRRASFVECDFTGANLDLARAQKTDEVFGALSADQRRVLAVDTGEAEEPPGG